MERIYNKEHGGPANPPIKQPRGRQNAGYARARSRISRQVPPKSRKAERLRASGASPGTFPSITAGFYGPRLEMTVKQNPACCKQTKGFKRAKIFPASQVKLLMSIVLQLLLGFTRDRPRFSGGRPGYTSRERKNATLVESAGFRAPHNKYAAVQHEFSARRKFFLGRCKFQEIVLKSGIYR